MQTRQRSLCVSDTQSERILFIVPYIKRTTDRIDRILNKHNNPNYFQTTQKDPNHPKKEKS